VSRVDRLLEIIDRTGRDSSMSRLSRLCHAGVDMLPVDGAGVSLIADDYHRCIGSSDSFSASIEALQGSFRTGPCFDAVILGEPVLAPRLNCQPMRDRWPGFTQSAVAAGARSVFGFPMMVKGVAIGALDLFAKKPQDLTQTDVADACVLAELVAITVNNSLDRGQITEVGLSSSLENAWSYPAVVHHAAGMTSVHLNIDIEQAMLRLRARAVGTGRALDDVATDIVAGRLRLER
jgi:GAF domain